MATSKFNLYFNIFVFTVIAGIVSLFLLLMLIFGSDAVAQYTALIVTIEVGLILNIVVSLYRIFKYERKLNDLTENSLENLLTVKGCPDYWTMTEGVNGTKCTRTYAIPQAPDETGGGTITVQGSEDTVNLASYNGQSMSRVCANVAKLDSPWTDVRAACNAFNVSMMDSSA